MDRPRVSAITIFLDAERFLAEAVESVLAQTSEAWELLLVDDGSSDASASIARSYVERDPRIRLLQHPGGANLGMSSSRNLGLRMARGDYVAFLDADDVWLPEKLERQAAILDERLGVGMTYGPTPYWERWSEGRDVGDGLRRTLGFPPGSTVRPPLLVRSFLRGTADTPATCAVLMRRSVAERVGAFEEGFRGLFEDQAFFYKVCLQETVFLTGEAWDLYRQHPDSACALALRDTDYHWARPNDAHRRMLEWLRRYLDERGIVDPEIDREIDQALTPYRAAAPRAAPARGVGGLRGWIRTAARWAFGDRGQDRREDLL